MPLNRSEGDPEKRFEKTYFSLKNINESHDGQVVRIRARLQNKRAQGSKIVFLEMREIYDTLQVLVFQQDTSADMCKYAMKIPNESIVEVVGTLVKPEKEIAGCTIKLELGKLTELWTVNKSAPELPF